jgi:hypothetical protein
MINLKQWWQRFKKKRKAKHFLNHEKKFTVACDKSPFWYPGNEKEQLFQVNGLRKARWAAMKWVWRHDCGQARVIEGWHDWEKKEIVPV